MLSHPRLQPKPDARPESGGTLTVQGMNDPHVQTLYYRVKHSERVTYENARSLEFENEAFQLRIENGVIEITMKVHLTTREDACAKVEPFLREWELTASLEFWPGDFEFVYDRATVIDRNPTPGVYNLYLSTFTNESTFGKQLLQADLLKYPDPPSGIARDADVELMFAAYCQYRAGERNFGGAAYYCLTALEGPKRHKRRQHAASRYAVDEAVLSKLGELTDNKGGKQARKAKGAGAAFTVAEKRWLEETMKQLIRRAAEVAYDPSASRPQITMAGLPPLKAI